ncbi:MAG: hypothetical protein IPJ74_25035 [Saprospiraceae bacterium]|nr:hypothetical protein [Saprospiraceae bacterium]
MAIEFQVVRVNFAREVGETGSFSQNTPRFSNRVIRAHNAINGFDLHYTNGDHHILQMMLNLNNSPVIGTDRRANK